MEIEYHLKANGVDLQSLKNIQKDLLTILGKKKPILLAFSGGLDSMALFVLLKTMTKRHSLDLHVVHVDHKMRQESSIEALKLKEFVEKEHIPFHLYQLDKLSLPQKNLEEFLRNERYGKIRQCYKEISAQALLIAHHQDDQAETILKRVFEGSFFLNCSGLINVSSFLGMKVIRPLLKCTKEDLKQFLVDQNITWIEDYTNSDVNYLRARMRHELIPFLEQSFQKSIKKNLIHLGSYASKLEDYLRTKTKQYENNLIKGPFGYCIDFKNKDIHPIECEYIVRDLLKSLGFFLSRDQMTKILEALENNGFNKLFKNKSFQLVVDDGRVFILLKELNKFPHEKILLSFSQSINICGIDFTLTKVAKPDFKPLWIKLWQGQIYYSFFEEKFFLTSCDTKSKKTQNFFCKMRVPSFLRTIFPAIAYLKTKGMPLELSGGNYCYCLKAFENKK